MILFGLFKKALLKETRNISQQQQLYNVDSMNERKKSISAEEVVT